MYGHSPLASNLLGTLNRRALAVTLVSTFPMSPGVGPGNWACSTNIFISFSPIARHHSRKKFLKKRFY